MVYKEKITIKSSKIIAISCVAVLLILLGTYLILKDRGLIPWFAGNVKPDTSGKIGELDISLPKLEMTDPQGNPVYLEAWSDYGLAINTNEAVIIHSQMANRCYIIDNKGEFREVYAPTNLVGLKTSLDKFAFSGKDRSVGVFSAKGETLYYDFHPDELTSIVFQDEDNLLVGGISKDTGGIVYKVSISQSEIIERIPLNEIPHKLYKSISGPEIYYSSDTGIYSLDGKKIWNLPFIKDFLFTKNGKILAVTINSDNTVTINRNDGQSLSLKRNFLSLFSHPDKDIYTLVTHYERGPDHIIQVNLISSDGNLSILWEKEVVNNIIRAETVTFMDDGTLVISYRGDMDIETGNYMWNLEAYNSSVNKAYERIGTYTLKIPVFSVFSWGDFIGVGAKGRVLKLSLSSFK